MARLRLYKGSIEGLLKLFKDLLRFYKDPHEHTDLCDCVLNANLSRYCQTKGPSQKLSNVGGREICDDICV
jgi:hypothetical protein